MGSRRRAAAADAAPPRGLSGDPGLVDSPVNGVTSSSRGRAGARAGRSRGPAPQSLRRSYSHAERKRPRGRNRRGGQDSHRARSSREGLLQGHAPQRAPRQDLHRGDRAGGHPGRGGRGRGHRLRAAVRRAGLQRRPQRLAAGGTAGGDAGHDCRPPVRLGPAGRELRRRADRRRCARRRDRLGCRAHGPHPHGRRLQVDRRRRVAVARGADVQVQPRAPGDLGRDDRRPVGDPALGARRDRPPLAPAGPPGHRGGPLRAGDRPLPGERLDLRGRPGAARTRTSRSCRSSSRPSRRMARSRPATRRRSRTARRPSC